jgi:glycosyltransferase involved in cell wall biosynthesis
MWMERRTLQTASALITVSEPLREDFLKMHEAFRERSFVILNGYDDDDYPGTPSSPPRPFTIAFTGRMYDIDFISKGRTPELLFHTIAKMIHDGDLPTDELQCLLYGEYPPQLTEMIAKYGLSKQVRCMGAVPIQEAVKVQQEADVLLLLSWDDNDRKGILTGKIFEYLGARKPILSIPYVNEGVDRILAETKAGVSATNEEQCRNILLSWYREFRDHGQITYHGIPEAIARYSRKKQTERLACVLDNVLRSHDRYESQ